MKSISFKEKIQLVKKHKVNIDFSDKKVVKEEYQKIVNSAYEAMNNLRSKYLHKGINL